MTDLRAKAKELLLHFISEKVIPWYERESGEKLSAKVLRHAVSLTINSSFGRGLWLWRPKEDPESPEVGEDDHLLKPSVDNMYFIRNVFPQSTGTGSYVLMVTVCSHAVNKHVTIELTQFLNKFIPYHNNLSFKDHDA